MFVFIDRWGTFYVRSFAFPIWARKNFAILIITAEIFLVFKTGYFFRFAPYQGSSDYPWSMYELIVPSSVRVSLKDWTMDIS
jgi:hypothetical protein